MIMRYTKAVERRVFDYMHYLVQVLMVVIPKHKPHVFLFGTPDHSNMGDQAQTFCTIRWLKHYYPNHKLISYDSHALQKNNDLIFRIIRRCIGNRDVIFLHSGYHTTDLYMVEETMQRKAIQYFPNNKIVVLPQTVNYTCEEEKNKSINIYNKHPNLFFFARDNISFELASKYFFNAKVFLFPDIVTSMIGKKHYYNDRKGILLCLRNDKESIIGKDTIRILKDKLSEIDFVRITDTTVSTDYRLIILNRKKYLFAIWDYFSRFKVIITDRYHGTIFSLITGTPVLVISSSDHKLSSGVKWFSKEYSSYVKYVEDIDSIENDVKDIYSHKYSYALDDYFDQKYYSKLKQLIE